MELKVKILGDKKVQEYLRRCAVKMPHVMRARLLDALIWIEQSAHRNIDAHYTRRSGGMIGGLTKLPITGTGMNIEGRVVERKEYGPYHEFGFHGSMTVHPHVRKISQAFGRPIPERSTFIRGHFRKVKYKGHPYLRPAFKSNRERIIRHLMKVTDDLKKA